MRTKAQDTGLAKKTSEECRAKPTLFTKAQDTGLAAASENNCGAKPTSRTKAQDTGLATAILSKANVGDEGTGHEPG